MKSNLGKNNSQTDADANADADADANIFGDKIENRIFAKKFSIAKVWSQFSRHRATNLKLSRILLRKKNSHS